MSTNATIRSAQTLVVFNGFGSSSGTSYDKGTPVSEILKDLASGARRMAANSVDKYQRDRMTYAKLVSDATGKVLREWGELELKKIASSSNT